MIITNTKVRRYEGTKVVYLRLTKRYVTKVNLVYLGTEFTNIP